MVSVDAQKAAKDTKTDHELGFCHDPALPKERGPRSTRKDAKGDERCGLGGPCHIARPDLGTRSCAIRRGLSRKRATPILDLSLRLSPAFGVRRSEFGVRSSGGAGARRCRAICFCKRELPASPKERGPRNTRKDAKGDEMRGVGWEAHVTSREPTLDAVPSDLSLHAIREVIRHCRWRQGPC